MFPIQFSTFVSAVTSARVEGGARGVSDKAIAGGKERDPPLAKPNTRTYCPRHTQVAKPRPGFREARAGELATGLRKATSLGKEREEPSSLSLSRWLLALSGSLANECPAPPSYLSLALAARALFSLFVRVRRGIARSLEKLRTGRPARRCERMCGV